MTTENDCCNTNSCTFTWPPANGDYHEVAEALRKLADALEKLPPAPYPYPVPYPYYPPWMQPWAPAPIIWTYTSANSGGETL